MPDTSTATHRCTVCGALWVLWPPNPAWPPPLRNGSWSVLTACGPCCDNAVMGDQIEPLGADEPIICVGVGS